METNLDLEDLVQKASLVDSHNSISQQNNIDHDIITSPITTNRPLDRAEDIMSVPNVSVSKDDELDEWDDDDDQGCVCIFISNEEVHELEELELKAKAEANELYTKESTKSNDISLDEKVDGQQEAQEEGDILVLGENDMKTEPTIAKVISTDGPVPMPMQLIDSPLSYDDGIANINSVVLDINDMDSDGGPFRENTNSDGIEKEALKLANYLSNQQFPRGNLDDETFKDDKDSIEEKHSLQTPLEDEQNRSDEEKDKNIDQSAIQVSTSNKRKRNTNIAGQHTFRGPDGVYNFFNLRVVFEPGRTGFEEHKDMAYHRGAIIAGRYQVIDLLGSAAFSSALQCEDLEAPEDVDNWVCLKVIKNNKDYFDQSLDEIKLLQFINSQGDADDNNVLKLRDYFYFKEHLFIVTELLKENLYEFGRYVDETENDKYYTIPRLKRIMKQVLSALKFVHSLDLIHCDIKPENIVIKSFSRCEVKLIDFGSSCFTTDNLTTYIQSRSYRAPEVPLGHKYDTCIDIWSLGAVLAELHTGYVLFQSDSVPAMLAKISSVVGPFPKHMLLKCKEFSKFFSDSNNIYEAMEDKSGINLLVPKKTTLRKRLHIQPTLDEAEAIDLELFLDFVKQMLTIDPESRVSAEEALRHPWLDDVDTIYVDPYIIK